MELDHSGAYRNMTPSSYGNPCRSALFLRIRRKNVLRTHPSSPPKFTIS